MQNLLEQPKPSIIKSINQVLDAIQVAAPIPAAHKKSLPHDIRDLSALLTEERGAMSRPYWAAKNLFSAYVHYFLPWNLYRLGWLLPTLPLQLQAGAFLVDLGSGPLTLPLALWCARPDLRQIPLRFLCTDVANQPMEQGLSVFDALTKGESPWSIECVKAPIESALIKLSEKVDVIMAGNVLNELLPAKGQTLQERIGGIVHSCSRKLKEGGSMLFVEPGTRLGGKVVIMAREAGRELGLPVLAPCSHQERCPLAKDMEREEGQTRGRPRGSQMASQTNMWCHFSFPVQGAPARLSKLTTAAKFDRRNLALSCLMMTTGEGGDFVQDMPDLSDLDYLDDLEALYDETMKADQLASQKANPPGATAKDKFGEGRARSARSEKTFGDKAPWEKARYFEGLEAVVDGTITPPLWTRIISGPIRLPKERLPARYGCCAAGLVLVRRCERIPYGAAVEVTWEKFSRDEKSGALMVDMVLIEENEFTEPKGARGRREGHGGRAGVLEVGELDNDRGRDGRGRREGRKQSEHAQKSDFGESKKASSASRRPRGEKGQATSNKMTRHQTPDNQTTATQEVSGLQSFFGRPQKMRERYGGLPQGLRAPAEKPAWEKNGEQKGPNKRELGEKASEGKSYRRSQGSDGFAGKKSDTGTGSDGEKTKEGRARQRKQETGKSSTRAREKNSQQKNEQRDRKDRSKSADRHEHRPEGGGED